MSTVFDRTLLRAGEQPRAHEHLYRQHTRAGFSFVPLTGLPAKAIVQHIGSDQRYELPLKWDEKDSAESTWEVPKDAKAARIKS